MAISRDFAISNNIMIAGEGTERVANAATLREQIIETLFISCQERVRHGGTDVLTVFGLNLW